jgi:hypothetical protein
MKRTIWLWTFWGAVLVSFPLPTFPFLKRKAAGTVRIANHESFEDEIRGLNREDGSNDHHQDEQHNFSFAEFAFVGPWRFRHFPFAIRLIERPSLFAALRIVAGGR